MADETAARQIGTVTVTVTVTLLGLLGGYMWVLHRRAPLPDTGTAVSMGGTWAQVTLGFEFGFGHYVLGTRRAELLADYDLSRGRIWVLVPIATAAAPLVRATADPPRRALRGSP